MNRFESLKKAPAKTAEEWAAEASKRPGEGRADPNPKAKPTNRIPLRLNDYEHQGLQALAEEAETSMQTVLRKAVRELIARRHVGAKKGSR